VGTLQELSVLGVGFVSVTEAVARLAQQLLAELDQHVE
jgi:hypothetical protein